MTKLNASGSDLAYSTFLGGTNGDVGLGIAVDGSGRVYVTGFTDSTDFPITRGAFDRTFNRGDDAFVTKLPTGWLSRARANGAQAGWEAGPLEGTCLHSPEYARQ